MLRADETGAVVSILIEVDFVRDAVRLQGGGVEPGVFDGDDFVLIRVPEKNGRQAVMYLEFAGGAANEFLFRLFTDEHCPRSAMGFSGHADDRVAEDREIGAWTDGRRVAFDLAVLGSVDQRGYEMPACRESHYADTLRIDLPFYRRIANLTHRFNSVLKLSGIAIPCAAEPITQQEDGDALFIEPESDGFRLAFIDAAVTAAWNQQHRRSIGFCREIRGECRDVLFR